jgi:coenzyme F420-reducing hydrogenase beta subunit
MDNCVQITKKQDCCGCTACYVLCPENCITMVEDEQGFLYPEVNKAICINCGLCIKGCPLNGSGYRNTTNPHNVKVYAVKHELEAVRMSSSSGGMFTALSDYVLDNHGAVFGAAFDETMVLKHMCATTKAERDKCKGSKYVQSNIDNSYTEAKKLLIQGKPVLFTGTPCQTAGLYSFLGRDYDNLYSCDIVCHGTPSPGVFRMYISFIEEKHGDKVIDIQFRNKDVNWRKPTMLIKTKRKQISSRLSWDPFGRLFTKVICYRPSCHFCKFTNTTRPSDITIADFWGIERSKPGFDDNKGISLVLVNTEKGSKIFQNVKTNLNVEESCLHECMQINLKEPTKSSSDSESFWADYTSGKSYKYLASKYAEYTLLGKIKFVLKRMVKKMVRYK